MIWLNLPAHPQAHGNFDGTILDNPFNALSDSDPAMAHFLITKMDDPLECH